MQDFQSESREQARTYLRRELRDLAPADLHLVGCFDEAPLEGEGRAAVFTIELPAAGAGGWEPCHYVIAGQTEPDYFPRYGLTPDEAYSFHIGGRFMLVMRVMRVDAQAEPPGAREAVRDLAAAYNPGVAVTDVELAGLFRCGDEHLAVYRLRLGALEVYCCGADCPPGFYALTRYPPQVTLRLHLGNLIRHEAREDAQRESTAGRVQDQRIRRPGG